MSKFDGFESLMKVAVAAGMEAGNALTPRAMVVSWSGGSEVVADGVCGFAWVTIKPGNSAFANWGKKQGFFSKAYGGGVQYWVGQFNQSMQKKEAFANAMAGIFRGAGVNAYADSRMD